MNDRAKNIEAKLEEFAEVHGTVLLGMHRELQTHTREATRITMEAERSLRNEARKVTETLRSAAASTTDTINRLAADVADCCSEATAHRNELQERLDQAKTQMAESIAVVSNKCREQVDGFSSTVSKRSKEAIDGFEALAKGFRESVQEQRSQLDEQAHEIRALNRRTACLLADVNNKVEAHNQREARHNRFLRRLLFAVALGTSIAVILLIWRPWLA